MVVDAITLDSIAEIENWRSARTVADGNILYGVWEGHLDRADLDTGVVEGLTVFSNPVYGPLVVLPTGIDRARIRANARPRRRPQSHPDFTTVAAAPPRRVRIMPRHACRGSFLARRLWSPLERPG